MNNKAIFVSAKKQGLLPASSSACNSLEEKHRLQKLLDIFIEIDRTFKKKNDEAHK